MNLYTRELAANDVESDDDNVIAFRARAKVDSHSKSASHSRAQGHSNVDAGGEHVSAAIDMQRFPVDIRGQVTFGRLVSGLATVGLTVRVDARSGRVVITDDTWE